MIPDGNRVLLYVSSYDINANAKDCRNTGSRFDHDKISIVAVPLGAPEDAAIIAEPVLFGDGGYDGSNHYTRETRGCHDITAYPAIDLAAGACMGDGILLDIADRENPVVTEQVRDTTNFAFWHSATFNNAGTKVIFTDELGGGGGAARIDDDDAGAARPLVRHHALPEDGMAPGGVGADQHQEVGLVEILIGARHRVGTEGAAMTGNRRGHAETRVGVDIGGADEPLHQLVGDVVVLGQQLARDIEGGRVRTMPGDGVGEACGNQVQRRIPACRLAADHRCKQTIVEPERLAQRTAFGTQPAGIGGMALVAADLATFIGNDAAADAAIGAGGAG